TSVVMLAAVSCGGSLPTALEVADFAERFGDAVWSVDADGCGWRAQGSAFAIDDRHLVTNQHVIANDSSPTIRSRDGDEIKGRVIGATVKPDVAIIEVSEDLPAALPWADTKSLMKREPLVVLGYPAPKNEFKTSTGRIVTFHPEGTREAALSDAPIAHGNSGGPALRSDASVAGIVTLMTLREKPEDQVAILFTADTIRSSVERFLETPKDVLSSCGLGPDYVPEIPDDFDIDEAPPTAAPVEVLPLPTDAVTAPKPLASSPPKLSAPPIVATAAACPDGGPVVNVDRVRSEEAQGSSGTWQVLIEGNVRSFGSRDIALERLEGQVDGPPVTTAVVNVAPTLEPGRAAFWSRQLSVYSPSGAPDEATAALEWSWLQAEFDHCSTEQVARTGPESTATPAASSTPPSMSSG
ncbi:MAG: serine protease, partial [Actinomycetota bacterium]